MTKNPFGVNITLLPSLNPPDYGAYAQAIIDEGIKIVETAGNSPGPVIRKLKEAGCIVLHKCSEFLPPFPFPSSLTAFVVRACARGVRQELTW